jgi:hypothetical protein
MGAREGAAVVHVADPQAGAERRVAAEASERRQLPALLPHHCSFAGNTYVWLANHVSAASVAFTDAARHVNYRRLLARKTAWGSRRPWARGRARPSSTLPTLELAPNGASPPRRLSAARSPHYCHITAHLQETRTAGLPITSALLQSPYRCSSALDRGLAKR